MTKSKEKMINVRISSTTAKTNERVNVCLEISNDYGFVEDAEVVINKQKRQNENSIKLNYLFSENNVSYFTCNISMKDVGLYYFYIKLKLNDVEKIIGLNQENNSHVMMNCESDFSSWTITVYDSSFSVPKWAKGKVMYQIFVDRFYKSDKYLPNELANRVTKKWGEMPEWDDNFDSSSHNNTDFFMGNLDGVIEKIPYLKELGVKIIYLSPICKSQSNHRYDVSDYEVVDHYVGTNDILQKLCTIAHENGMRVVVDAVFNHTGNDSKYFNEFGSYDTIGAFQSDQSCYYDWYKKDEKGNFKYWWGFKNLPVCDGENEEWQKYICGENGIIDKWFERGIDGLRLDVTDELTDDFVEKVRNAVKRNKEDSFIIGEVWENAVTKEKDGVQRKYMLGRGIDTVMNYPFTNAILKYIRFGDYKYFIKTVSEIITQYPKDCLNSLMNSLSTHDITRALTTLASGEVKEESNLIWDVEQGRKWQYENDKLSDVEYEETKEMFKLATIIQYFLPGNSCIYYGDEIGMYGYRDPFNRKCFAWDKIDEELHQFFIELSAIKNNNDFLSDADLKIIKIDNNILAFERKSNDQKMLIAINRGNSNINIEFLMSEYGYNNIIFEHNLSKNILQKLGFVICK